MAKIFCSKEKYTHNRGNWHGRTMGAQMMSGNIGQKKWIGYEDQFIHHIPFYPWDVDEENGENFFNSSINNLIKKKTLVRRILLELCLRLFRVGCLVLSKILCSSY